MESWVIVSLNCLFLVFIAVTVRRRDHIETQMKINDYLSQRIRMNTDLMLAIQKDLEVLKRRGRMRIASSDDDKSIC